MKFYNLLLIINPILIIVLILVIYNNYKLNKYNTEMKITHINNFIKLLNMYEDLLKIDVRGYFRTDDEVGILFDTINTTISNYMEYLSTQIDVLEVDEDDFILIDGVDIIMLNEKILNIKNLQRQINAIYKDEQSLFLKQKYEYKSNPGGKLYMNN
jgi:hypothetical protein